MGDENEGGGRAGLWEQWVSTGGEVDPPILISGCLGGLGGVKK